MIPKLMHIFLDTMTKYQVVYKNMIWKEARAYCRNMSGELASFKNEEEQEDAMGGSETDDYWIGKVKNAVKFLNSRHNCLSEKVSAMGWCPL